MSPPTVTALYGAINAALNIALAMRVSFLRIRHGVSTGTGESKELHIAVRTHANNAEFVPLAIVTLLIAELCGGASLWMHLFGGSLFLGRLLHVVGMPRKAPNAFRFAGNTFTWGVIVLASVYAIWLRTPH